MKPQGNQDWESKLQQLETEINQSSSSSSKNMVGANPTQQKSKKIDKVFVSVRQWFNNLPTSGKLAVGVVAAIVGFSLLKTVLQIVTSVLALGFLGVVGYLFYKFFIVPRTRE